MKNLHSVRYYEKRLAKLERVADSIGYPIDDNADYIRATALLPLTVCEGGEVIPAQYFGNDTPESVFIPWSMVRGELWPGEY